MPIDRRQQGKRPSARDNVGVEIAEVRDNKGPLTTKEILFPNLY